MAGSGRRQVEAVTAEQAEVVSQHMAVERLAELRPNRTATDASGQAAENGAGYRTKCDTDRAGDYTKRCAGLQDDKEGVVRCRFAWEWLQKDRALALRIPPSFESYIELVMYFDSMDLRERELKDIAQSIRRSWNRQRYLEKLKGKKQYNFILSEESVELLDELARASGLKRPQVLERLIKAEADRRGDLAPIHPPSNSD